MPMKGPGGEPDAAPDVAAEALKAQVERILASPEFRQAGRTSDFLRFVVDEKIAGRSERLKEHTIAQEVFHRDESFDPKTSSLVRVEAGRLRAKLDRYYRSEGRDDPIVLEIPKGGYAPVLRPAGPAAPADATDADNGEPPKVERRLAAILAVEVAGRGAPTPLWQELLAPATEAHHGRVVRMADNEALAAFASAIDAIECAVALQRGLARATGEAADAAPSALGLGVSLGELAGAGAGLEGDVVETARRLAKLAEPGGLWASGTVMDQIRSKWRFGAEDMGGKAFEDMATPARAYRLEVPPEGGEGSARALGRLGRSAVAIGSALAIAVVAAWLLGERVPLEAGVGAGLAEGLGAARQEGPSILVLPFANLSDDSGQDYVADGITEEIITRLTRFRELSVIGRTTSFSYKTVPVDAKKLGRKLGVDYVLHGTIRRVASTIRVTAQLEATDTGANLWAEVYDRDLTTENVLSMQDAISRKVVATVADPTGVISRAEISETKHRGARNLDAYRCVLRLYAHRAEEDLREHAAVRACLLRAVAEDPDYADAWAGLASLYIEEYRRGLAPGADAADPLDAALESAQRAVELDPENARAHQALAGAHFHRRELGPFMAASERALQLNPNNSDLLAELGMYSAFAGRWFRGLTLLRRAIALNPTHPGWYHLAFIFDYYRRGDYAKAMSEARKISAPNWYWSYVGLAMTAGRLGDRAEAAAATARLRALQPDFAREARAEFRRLGIYSDSLIESFMDGLRRAGLEAPGPAAAPLRQPARGG